MNTTTFARPRLVVSLCLGFEACRYDGSLIPNDVVKALTRHAEIITTCPEVEIGLGTPRPPIRLVQIDGEAHLIRPDDNSDLTDAMQTFARRFVATLPPVDGFILKNRSPSCGIRDAVLYAASGKGRLGTRPGLFTEAVLERFGDYPIEDEGRLTNRSIREHFFTAIFALAALRQTIATGRLSELVAFHTRYKLLLMAYNQQRLKELGRIVANREHRPFNEVADTYAATFRLALKRPPRRTSVLNVLMHALGYVSDGLSHAEKATFLDLLEAYRAEQVPLSAPLALLRGWVVRFQQPYLSQQAFFTPFPNDLVSLKDSGRIAGWV